MRCANREGRIPRVKLALLSSACSDRGGLPCLHRSANVKGYSGFAAYLEMSASVTVLVWRCRVPARVSFDAGLQMPLCRATALRLSIVGTESWYYRMIMERSVVRVRRNGKRWSRVLILWVELRCYTSVVIARDRAITTGIKQMLFMLVSPDQIVALCIKVREWETKYILSSNGHIPEVNNAGTVRVS